MSGIQLQSRTGAGSHNRTSDKRLGAWVGELQMHRVVGLAVWLICSGLALAQDPAGYQLVWSDDFTGSALDTSRWSAEFSTQPTNNSLHAYLPSQVSVGNGNLVITSVNQAYGGLPYRSGLVRTLESRKYGRWEVRAKLPTSTGMWPAIWLLPDTSQYPWPSGGEIDIMENRGNEPETTSSAFHYGTNPPYRHLYTFDEYERSDNGVSVNFHAGFHTYAAEWDENEIRYFVDDDLHFTVTDASVGGAVSAAAPMQLVINTAVGGDFLRNPDDSTVWPQQFEIDSVKVYAPSSPNVSFFNGGFDANGGSLDGWSIFGDAGSNVSAATQAVRSGSHSLKLYGEFSGSTSYSGAAQGMPVSGGDEIRASAEAFIRSQDSIQGTGNRVIMKVEYYNTFGGSYGTDAQITEHTLVIADGASAPNQWKLDQLTSTAPAGAVEARVVFVFAQPHNEAGAVHIDNVKLGARGDYTYVWDQAGDGVWSADRWTGGFGFPSDFDNVIVKSDQVAAVGSLGANNLIVESGTLDLVGEMTTPKISVLSAGTLAGGGIINGDLGIGGTLQMDPGETLHVNGDVAFAGSTQLTLADDFVLPRGMKTGDTVVLRGDAISGMPTNTSGNSAMAHLGDGRFLWSLDVQPTELVVDVYSALRGDANGDGIVDVSDFNIWNTNRNQSNADWTMGDFNLDRVVDDNDFALWYANRFASASFFVAVPEPGGWGVLVSGGLLLLLRRRRRISPAHVLQTDRFGAGRQRS